MLYKSVQLLLGAIDTSTDPKEQLHIARRLLVSLEGAGAYQEDTDTLLDLRVRLEDSLVRYRQLDQFLKSWHSLKTTDSDPTKKLNICAAESPCVDFEASSWRRILCGLQALNANIVGTSLCYCRRTAAEKDTVVGDTIVVPATNTTQKNSRVVELTRGAAGFGMNIGSVDGIFRVTETLAGGVAEASGAVWKDDRIIAVNDVQVTHQEHEFVICLLKAVVTARLHLVADGGKFIFLKDRAIVPFITTTQKNSRVVELTRGVDGFGMEIVRIDGVFRVMKALAGGVAAASGVVQTGDRIIAINDVLVTHEKHEVVVHLLRTAATVRMHLVADASELPPREDFVDDDGLVVDPADEIAATNAYESWGATGMMESKVVHVKRGAAGIDMCICRRHGDYYVSAVLAGGAAEESGTVNGTFTTGKSVDEVVGLLTASDTNGVNRVTTHL